MTDQDHTQTPAINGQESVRLSINLAPDVAAVLASTAANAGVNITDGVRRAIILWHLVSTECAKGSKVMVVEGEGPNATFREVIQ